MVLVLMEFAVNDLRNGAECSVPISTTTFDPSAGDRRVERWSTGHAPDCYSALVRTTVSAAATFGAFGTEEYGANPFSLFSHTCVRRN
jgi:hypothetical protein